MVGPGQAMSTLLLPQRGCVFCETSRPRQARWSPAPPFGVDAFFNHGAHGERNPGFWQHFCQPFPATAVVRHVHPENSVFFRVFRGQFWTIFRRKNEVSLECYPFSPFSFAFRLARAWLRRWSRTMASSSPTTDTTSCRRRNRTVQMARPRNSAA